jgi:hypothetical protein
MASLIEPGSDTPPASSADKTTFMETICSWTLRVILPVLLVFGALLFYWVWIDGDFAMTAWRIACLIPLGISFIAIAIWAFKEISGTCPSKIVPGRSTSPEKGSSTECSTSATAGISMRSSVPVSAEAR